MNQYFQAKCIKSPLVPFCVFSPGEVYQYFTNISKGGHQYGKYSICSRNGYYYHFSKQAFRIFFINTSEIRDEKLNQIFK